MAPLMAGSDPFHPWYHTVSSPSPSAEIQTEFISTTPILLNSIKLKNIQQYSYKSSSL